MKASWSAVRRLDRLLAAVGELVRGERVADARHEPRSEVITPGRFPALRSANG
jgi:hypothetical protein